MTQWYNVDTFGYKGLDARLSYTWEEMTIRDSFDFDEEEFKEYEYKVNSGELLWIMARLELYLGGVVIGESIMGGLLVKSEDELKGYLMDDLCEDAYIDAQFWYNKNKDTLESLHIPEWNHVAQFWYNKNKNSLKSLHIPEWNQE